MLKSQNSIALMCGLMSMSTDRSWSDQTLCPTQKTSINIKPINLQWTCFVSNAYLKWVYNKLDCHQLVNVEHK